MKSLLPPLAAHLYQTLDPSTEAGRLALSALSQEEVEQLRVNHKQGAARRLLAAAAPGTFLLLMMGVAGGAVAGGLFLDFAGAAVVALAVGFVLSQGHLRLVAASEALANLLQPMSKNTGQCEEMLKRVEGIPACRAYRDAVASHRELVQGDGLAAFFIEQDVKAQAKAQKRAENLARQEEACRKLHGLVPLSEQPA